MKAIGYALKYDKPDRWGRVYSKGCLDNVDLSMAKITDGTGQPYGTIENGMLELEVDSKGLMFTIEFDEKLSYVADTIQNIANGNITGAGIEANIKKVNVDLDKTIIQKISRLYGVIISAKYDNFSSSIKILNEDKRISEMTNLERNKFNFLREIELMDM